MKIKGALLIISLIFCSFSHAKAKITSEYVKGKFPKSHLLTIRNETDHKIFIKLNKTLQKIAPHQAVVLGWDKSMKSKKPCTIDIYYGGNISEKNPSFSSRKKRSNSIKSQPAFVAQLKTNQPGTVALFYSNAGILKMERLPE